MGILQLNVGLAQSAGGADAEEEEDGKREDDDGGDDDDAAALLLCALALLLHLDVIHVENGVHLRQLALHLVAVDGVRQLVHLVVQARSLFIAAYLRHDLRPLHQAADVAVRLVARVREHPDVLGVIVECFIIETFLHAQLGTEEEPCAVAVVVFGGNLHLCIAQHLCGMVQAPESQVCLCVADVVIGPGRHEAGVVFCNMVFSYHPL